MRLPSSLPNLSMFGLKARHLWDKFCDCAFYVNYSRLGIKKNCQWKTRAIYQKAIKILASSELAAKDQESFRQSLSALIIDSKSAFIWLKRSKKQLNTLQQERCNHLEKFLRGIKLLEKAERKGQIESLNLQLDQFFRAPDLLLKSDLTTRSLIVCLAKFGEAFNHFDKRFDLSRSENATLKLAKKWCENSANCQEILRALRTSKIWNSRMVMFHTQKGFSSLDFSAKKPSPKKLDSLLAPEHLHSALLAQDRVRGVRARHITYSNFSENGVSDKEMQTSEIMQVETKKLFVLKDTAALANQLHVSDGYRLFKEVDRRLENAIEKEVAKAARLNLKNSNWARWRTPLIALKRSRSGMKKGSLLSDRQNINCCHFVASILFKAVEKTNEELSKILPNQPRVLRPILNPDLNPAGIMPSVLYEKLRDVSSIVQTN